ncbi:unnamed protein product [Adineta steineri]|uniref:Uncharacterized protein n=2 Tax=Adineta steineri TaxID=433720 RepID=A0A818X0T8_9BILA|nr:unnamed protein product [Adineta steineri]CAF1408389.1 unnamed protein product [Adineta steineri]CAF3733309.1 unnamed protein product [Adineta steineri]
MMLLFLFVYFLLFISSIQTCPLKIVDTRSGCYCGIEIDGTNYIQCHPYSINQIPEFTRSYIHDKLNLSRNSIEYLTNKSFQQLKVKRIYLEYNPIKSIDKQTFNHNNLLHYLEELYIDTLNNHTVEFLCYGTWKNLRILKLSGFNLNQYQYCLEKFYRLEKLTIQNSQIPFISYYIYQLPVLYELSLINNSLKEFAIDEQSISSIRILNLTSNQLHTIPNDINIRLPNLITLDLSHNFIEQIPNLQQTTILYLNLSYNQINSFEIKQNQYFIDLSSNPICTIDKTNDLTNILLNNLTNLHCDCRLGYFLKDNLFDNQTICSTPDMFHGLYVKDLTYEQLMSVCLIDLPLNCKEITNFKEIQQYAQYFINTTEQILNTTKITETIQNLNNEEINVSSFRLTSFYTLYENNDLLVFWDFDTLLTDYLLTAQLQIIIEHESQIIRRSKYLSPYVKQYIIPHIPPNKNYYVCLLLKQSSYGTNKYCREVILLTNQTFSQLLYVNRSIVFGFFTGTILTTCLLVTLAFICHLHYKRKHFYPLYHHPHHHHHHPHQQQQRYMYIHRTNDEGTYKHSILSSSLSKQQRRRGHLKPLPTWYQQTSKQLSSIPRSPCCLLQYHDRTLSSSTTTNRMISLSSEYSNGIDKEPMTSTSIMSNMSLDDQESHTIQSPTKHVYEELGDNNLFV